MSCNGSDVNVVAVLGPNNDSSTTNPDDVQHGWANLSWKGKEGFMVLYIWVAVVGTIGNSVVIWIYFGTAKLRRQITNTFIINLAFSDMMTCLLIIPFKVVTYKIPGGVTGQILCRVFVSQYFLWSSGLASVYTLFCVTVERYVAIMHSLRYHAYFNRKKAVIMCIASWSLALLGQTYEFFTFKYKNFTCDYIPITLSRILVSYEGIVILSLNIVMIITFFKIKSNLEQSYKPAQKFSAKQRRRSKNPDLGVPMSNNDPRQRDAQKAHKRLTKMMYLVVGAYFICWVGVGVFNLILIADGTIYGGIPGEIVVILAVANSCVNPFIYVLKSQTFRRNLLLKLGRGKKAQHQFTIPDTLSQDGAGGGVGVNSVNNRKKGPLTSSKERTGTYSNSRSDNLDGNGNTEYHSFPEEPDVTYEVVTNTTRICTDNDSLRLERDSKTGAVGVAPVTLSNLTCENKHVRYADEVYEDVIEDSLLIDSDLYMDDVNDDSQHMFANELAMTCPDSPSSSHETSPLSTATSQSYKSFRRFNDRTETINGHDVKYKKVDNVGETEAFVSSKPNDPSIASATSVTSIYNDACSGTSSQWC